MNVDPTRSGQTRGPAAERLKEPAAPPASRRDGSVHPEPIPARDRVELSPEARELQRPALEPAVQTLSSERMKGILQRLVDGFYDRAEVRDDLLRRLAPDVEDGPARP